MNVEIQKMNWGQAYAGYREVRDALRNHPDVKHLKIASRAYFHLQRGHGVLDVYEAIKKAGLNADGEPKLGIAPSHAVKGCFRKQNSESCPGYFYTNERGSWNDKIHVSLPAQTFPKWPLEDKYSIRRHTISSPVPLVPAKLMPRGELQNFFTLWEVDHWNPEPAKDPILLRRISDNLFVVLGSWDTTPLERSILRGMYK